MPGRGNPEINTSMVLSNRSWNWLLRVAAVVAVVFGVATIRAGGAVLFGDGAAAAGTVVGFVLWFNFLAGFGYVAAGIALWMRRRWGSLLATLIAAGTLLVFAAFGVHIALGGAFEARTAWAMLLRSVVWVLIAVLALRVMRRRDVAPASPAVSAHGIASDAD